MATGNYRPANVPQGEESLARRSTAYLGGHTAPSDRSKIYQSGGPLGYSLVKDSAAPGGIYYNASVCGTSHRYNCADLAAIAGHDHPPSWQPWF